MNDGGSRSVDRVIFELDRLLEERRRAVLLGPPKPAPQSPEALAETARIFLRMRDIRSVHLPAQILGEPRWGILSLLMSRAQDDPGITFEDACFATGVPLQADHPTIFELSAHGLIEIQRDSRGDNRPSITMTSLGHEQMTKLLSILSKFFRAGSK